MENDKLFSKSGVLLGEYSSLRKVRELVGKEIVSSVNIDEVTGDFPGEGARSYGVLFIYFENGNRYSSRWASYKTLCNSLSNWRNLYGVPLCVRGARRGEIRSDHPLLTN